MEQWQRKETIYQGRIFSVVAGEAQLPDGSIVPREIVAHRGGVAIVPVLDETVILLRQFRIAVGREILELPAGRLEGEESPEYRARCELEEETGYRAEELILAASYYSSAGFTNERMYIYLAFDLQHVGQQLEFDEQVTLVHMPLADVQRALAADGFEDAKTIIGLHKLLQHLNNRSVDTPTKGN